MKAHLEYEEGKYLISISTAMIRELGWEDVKYLEVEYSEDGDTEETGLFIINQKVDHV